MYKLFKSYLTSNNWISQWFKRRFFRIVSKFTWEAPQQLLGVIQGDFLNMIGDVKSISHSDGATLIARESYSWKGWTFGSIILWAVMADAMTEQGSDNRRRIKEVQFY